MSYFATFKQLPAALDAFGRLRVSEPQTSFASKLLYDSSPSSWDDVEVSGSGTSSTYNTNQSSVTLAVSASTAGRRVRQTYRRMLYQPGKSQLVSMTGILGAPAAGITRGIGLYDDSDGIFFQSAGAAVSAVIRSSASGAPVDVAVPQASWNVDPMDGAGPSGITLDFSKTQIFFFDFQWLGVGTVTFGVVVNGAFYEVHREPHANLTTTVYMSNPNLPLRYEVANSGAGGAASLLAICNSVLVEGGLEFAGQQRAVSRGTSPLVTLNDADLYPLAAIRLQSAKRSSTVQPAHVSVLSTTNSNMEVQLLLNPTVTGTALSFSPVANSAVEADVGATNATKVTGGSLLFSSLVAAQAAIQVPNPVDFELGASVAGVSNVLVLAVRRLTGTAETIYGSLGWRESS